MGRVKKRMKPRGELCPERLYSARGILRAMGWGRTTLQQAKSSGVVKVYEAGGMSLFKGSELIEWATTVGDKSRTTTSKVDHVESEPHPPQASRPHRPR